MPSADDKSTPNSSRHFTSATIRKSTSKNNSKKWEGPLDRSASHNSGSRWADGTASPWDEESRGSRRWEPLRVAAPEPVQAPVNEPAPAAAEAASTSRMKGLFAQALRRKQS